MVDEAERFGRTIFGKSARKLKAQAADGRAVWLGLGMFGVIGWSVAVPTVLGALLGSWLDKHHPGAHSWTLALLVAGLVVGCANAGYWIVSQSAVIGGESSHDE